MSPIAIATQCAWCMTEAHQELGNGSHGICAKHSAQILHAYQSEQLAKASQALWHESCQVRAQPGRSYCERFKDEKAQ